MYLKNLPNITGILPETRRRSYFNKNLIHFNHFSQNKGSRSRITAFLILLMSVNLFLGCETPGSVGDNIITEEDTIETTTIVVDRLNIVQENAFSGRLSNTPLGYLQDPVYGTIKSAALIKPVLSRAQVDTIRENTTIFLRLIFNPLVYGSESAASEFEIFEAGEIWRGTQLRYNREVNVDFGSKVAEFQVVAQDTVVIELSGEWTQKFAGFFNNEAADRDSLYRNNFPGLAIVPSENNQKIRFIKHSQLAEGDLITSFLVDTTSVQTIDEDDDGEENGASPELVPLDVRDWGASFIRTDEPEYSTGIVLHNGERALFLDIDLPRDSLKTKNIVNAQLVLSKDFGPESLYPGILRPRSNLTRLHVFNQPPADLMGEIFTFAPTNPNVYSAVLGDEEETFKMDITQHILNEVYGNIENRKPYLTLQSVNGIVYSSRFFDNNAPDNLKPRIVITTLK
jgi:hypothetical protein